MIKQLIKINSILNLSEKRKLILLAFAKFISGLMDMIGVASIVPFLAVISNKDILESNQIILKFKSFLSLGNNELILLFAVTSLLFLILNQLTRLLSLWYENYVSHGLWFSFHTKLFKYYLTRPYIFHIKTNSNQLLEKLSIQANASVAGLITPFFQILGNIFTFIFLIILLFIADPFATVVLLITTSLFYILIFTNLKKRIEEYGQYGPEFSSKTFKLSDQAFRSIKDIKVKNNAIYYTNLFNSLAKRYAQNSVNFQFLTQFPRSAMELFIYLFGYLIIIYLLIFESQQFNNIIIILGVYALALQKLLPATQNIFHQISQVKYYEHSFKKIYDDLKSCGIEQKNQKNNFNFENKEKIFKKKINFKKVKFQYPSSNKIALEVEDIIIEKNKFIGITGPTGSGKSTFIDILIGLLKPTYGEVFIDENNLNKFRVEEWTKEIGYAPQSAFMADDTIKNNIALGLESSSIDINRIKEVCKICEIYDFIEQDLPKKYDTVIGENGVRLSGGQKQRLSLARAIYKKPDLLILDESTNSLDSNTETLILNNFLKEKNLTIIIISHRISTLKSCDQIILFNNGKINAIGKYDYLFDNNKIFKNLADDKKIKSRKD